MDLILGGFDLLLLRFGANPLIWLAFLLVGLGMITGARWRRAGDRLEAIQGS